MIKLYSDQTPPKDVSACLTFADPGYAIAMRLRSLQVEDRLIRVPVTGLGAGFFYLVEEAALASTSLKEFVTTVKNMIMDGANAAAAQAAVLPTLNPRVIDTPNETDILKAFGLTVPETPTGLKPEANAFRTLPYVQLTELLAELNGGKRFAVAPLSGLAISRWISSAAAMLQASIFTAKEKTKAPVDKQIPPPRVVSGGVQLNSEAMTAIDYIAILRLVTGFHELKFTTAIPTERVARLKAAALALQDYSTALYSVLLAGDAASLSFARAFLSSDLAIDALRDEEGIRLRAATLEEAKRLGFISILGMEENAIAYFAPRADKFSDGTPYKAYLMPPLLDDIVPGDQNKTKDELSLPSVTFFDPGEVWVVKAAGDEEITRSKLFKFQASTSHQRTSFTEAIRLMCHKTIAYIRIVIDYIRDHPSQVMGRLAETERFRIVTPLSAAGPVLDLKEYSSSLLADEAPAVLAGHEADAHVSKDPGLIKLRPLMPSAVQTVPAEDVASLGAVYSARLSKRMTDLQAPQQLYTGSKKPVTTMFLTHDTHFLSGTWPLAEEPGFYTLWPKAYFPQPLRYHSTLSTPALMELFPLTGPRARTILMRDASSSPLKVAAALSAVGYVIEVEPDDSGKSPSVTAAGYEVMKLLAGQPTKAKVIEPRRPYNIAFASILGPKPTDGATMRLSYTRYSYVGEILNVLEPLSIDGRLYFLPHTHVPAPASFDGISWVSGSTDMSLLLYKRATFQAISRIAQSPESSLGGDPVIGSYNTVKAVQYGKAADGSIPAAQKWEPLRFANSPATTTTIDTSGEWWPMMGVVKVDGLDVRLNTPFTVAIGQRDMKSRIYLVKREEGRLPKYLGDYPVGAMIMTDRVPPSLSRYVPKSTYYKNDVPLGSDDWVAAYVNPLFAGSRAAIV
jgi:hypothetical protein